MDITRSIAEDPWKGITVQWRDSLDENNTVSPWEIVKMGEDPQSDSHEALDPTQSCLVVELLEELISTVDSCDLFVEHVDFRNTYLDYLLNIAYPMCLDTIIQRLNNNFYRRIAAVTFDMHLIQRECTVLILTCQGHLSQV